MSHLITLSIHHIPSSIITHPLIAIYTLPSYPLNSPLLSSQVASVLNWAQSCERCGRLDQAEQLYIEALMKMRFIYGESHRDTLACMHSLGRFDFIIHFIQLTHTLHVCIP